jgi:hypothetical protein
METAQTAVGLPVRAGREEREQLIEAYGRYLVERDGAPGADGETLFLREQGMQRLRAQRVRYRGPADEAAFRHLYGGGRIEADTPPELLLLSAFVKINSQEAFAVETIKRVKTELTPLEGRVLLQENYHTRLLLSATDLFELSVPERQRPLAALRVVVGVVARTPPGIMHTLALASEILGVANFLRLLRATRTTMRAHPELRDALEERVLEVCTDEAGHMSFNRLKVGAFGMAVARGLLPMLVAGFRHTTPELDRLCGGPLTLRELAGLSFADLPEAARRQAFIA